MDLLYENSNGVNLTVADDIASSAITLPTRFPFGSINQTRAYVSVLTSRVLRYAAIFTRLEAMAFFHSAHLPTMTSQIHNFLPLHHNMQSLHSGMTSILAMVASSHMKQLSLGTSWIRLMPTSRERDQHLLKGHGCW